MSWPLGAIAAKTVQRHQQHESKHVCVQSLVCTCFYIFLRVCVCARMNEHAQRTSCARMCARLIIFCACMVTCMLAPTSMCVCVCALGACADVLASPTPFRIMRGESAPVRSRARRCGGRQGVGHAVRFAIDRGHTRRRARGGRPWRQPPPLTRSSRSRPTSTPELGLLVDSARLDTGPPASPRCSLSPSPPALGVLSRNGTPNSSMSSRRQVPEWILLDHCRNARPKHLKVPAPFLGGIRCEKGAAPRKRVLVVLGLGRSCLRPPRIGQAGAPAWTTGFSSTRCASQALRRRCGGLGTIAVQHWYARCVSRPLSRDGVRGARLRGQKQNLTRSGRGLGRPGSWKDRVAGRLEESNACRNRSFVSRCARSTGRPTLGLQRPTRWPPARCRRACRSLSGRRGCQL